MFLGLNSSKMGVIKDFRNIYKEEIELAYIHRHKNPVFML